jgi:hypothetical protein
VVQAHRLKDCILADKYSWSEADFFFTAIHMAKESALRPLAFPHDVIMWVQGLEFDNVIMASGHMHRSYETFGQPGPVVLDEVAVGEVEEEANLVYVALTRSKNALVINQSGG